MFHRTALTCSRQVADSQARLGRYLPAVMVICSQRGRGTLGRAGAIALMPVAGLAVHQLRYWWAFGGSAGAELQAQGHAYLHSLVPWIVVLVAIAAGTFLSAVGRALGGRVSVARYTLSFTALWLLCAMSLVALYVCQEFLEGLFATGHPAGLAGIFGYGGWWSVPAALLVGLVLAAVFHGARWVIGEVARRSERLRSVAALRPLAARAPGVVSVPRLVPLADGWSGRGPPR
jgi:hypothetical protein